MRRIFIALLLCSALLLAAAGERAQQPAQPQQPSQSQEPAPPSGQQPLKTGQTIVREINLVDVLFTVLNRRNKLVTDLDKPNFRVLDDVVRRVIVLISDGDDNLSDRTRAEAIEMAQRTSVVIYAISTSTQWVTLTQNNEREKSGNRKLHLTEGDQILRDIAEETGGRAFFPYHVDDLDQSFQDIGDELRSQYSLAYNPSNYVSNGKYHKIRIEVPEHKSLQVRARRGYYARTTTLEPPSKPSGSSDQ